MVTWDRVTDADVLRATQEYDRLGPERFFAAHGFGPTTTYDLKAGVHRPAQATAGQVLIRQRPGGRLAGSGLAYR